MIFSKSAAGSEGPLVVVLALALNFLQPVAGIDMKLYHAAAGVDAAFGNFLERYYAAAEGDTTTTAGFVAFFAPEGTVAYSPVQNYTGHDQIATFKEEACSGDCVGIYHFPTVTTVQGEDSAEKTFSVQGLSKVHYVNGTCVPTSFESRFTVLKDGAGKAELCPGSGSLALLDLVSRSPTGGTCQDF